MRYMTLYELALELPAAYLCNVPNASRTNILILFYYLDEPDC